MQSPCDYEHYKYSIRQQFTTHEEAIARLRRHNKLPTAFDVSRPPFQVWNALGSIAYLTDQLHNGGSRACRDTMVSVKKNWTSGANIGLWVTFLIENVALVDESKGPFTPEGVDLLDKVLHVLGLLLLYPQKADAGGENVEARILRRASPNLPLLSANVWLRVLELSHATWHTWSAVVTFVMYIGPDIKSFADYLSQVHWSGKLDVTRIYIRHLLLITQHFGDMGEQRFMGLQTFMSLVYISSTTSTKRPLTSPFLLNGGIPALMNLLKMFITRPKMLQPTPNDPMGFHRGALMPLVHGASLLGDFLATPMWISQALDLGLLILMFKAKWLFAYEKAQEIDDKDNLKMGNRFSKMLNTITVFIVYPSVYTRVLKSMKHIIDSGLEEGLQPRSEPFWSSWERCKSKAIFCKDLFNTNIKSMQMCGYYEGCPNKGTRHPADEKAEKIRYLKCSACSSVSYCSRECGKKGWPSHREECSRNRQLMKEGAKLPSFMETQFFAALVKFFALGHASRITLFDPSGPQTPLDRTKRQSVVIYFDDPTGGDLMSPTQFKILDSESLQKDPRLVPQVFSEWQKIASNAKDDEVVLVGLFPAIKDDPVAIPIIEVFPRDQPQLAYEKLRRKRAEENGENPDNDENDGGDTVKECSSDVIERLDEDIEEDEGRSTTSDLESVD